MPILKAKPISVNNTSDLWDKLNISLPPDISIINLDGRSVAEINNKPIEYHKYFNDDLFKLMIVHELDMNSIPFLKLADHIIYLTEQQRLVAERIIGITVPSTVLPYPIFPMEKTVGTNNIITFISDYSDENKKSLMHIAKSWTKEKFNSDLKILEVTDNKQIINRVIEKNERLAIGKLIFTAIFKVNDSNMNSTYKKFIKAFGTELEKHGVEFRDYLTSPTGIESVLKITDLCYIFNRELSLELFDKLIANNDPKLIHSRYTDNCILAKAISIGCNIIIADGISTHRKEDRPSSDEWIEAAESILNNRFHSKYFQKLTRARTVIDPPTVMNITDGSPLMTDYVFVINYRNQSAKIERAIKSVLSQNRNFSFGIAITDDCSTDNSIEVVRTTLYECGVPYVVNMNRERKYSARNLWCAVRYLSRNQEAIIIELDGDDFLAPDVDILSILDKEYRKGMLKTGGAFQCYPDKWPEMEQNQMRYDINNPWDHSKCSVWIPLRSYKKSLFEKIEIEYFLERDTKKWLTSADDASIGPRMIELAEGKVSKIDDILYMYDTSGTDHDEAIVGWTPWYSHTKLYHSITF